MSLSPTGWSELFVSVSFLVGVDLPVRERLRAGADVGNVGIDPGRKIRAVGTLAALGDAGGLVVALRDPGLLPSPLVRRGS